MEQLPKQVLKILKEAAEEHKEDISSGVDSAFAKIQKLKNKDVDKWKDLLIRCAIRDLIHDQRHASNVKMRKDSGGYFTSPKVSQGSEAVNRASESLYTYFIAGRTLGELFGEELEDIASNEMEKANGHAFNAKLCDRLKRHVKQGQQVKAAIPEKTLKRIFREVQRGLDKDK